MRRLPLCLLASTLFASSAPARPTAGKIGDSYAKVALLALKAVESDGTVPEIRDGQQFVNRLTQEKIDAADVEATSDEERALTKDLYRIYLDHLTNNLNRTMLRLRAQIALLGAHKPTDEGALSEVLRKDPDFLEIVKHEDTCFSALDSSLRVRSSASPPECASIAVKLK
jgi:hypothetical protein